jgi:hypothetical protein
LFLSCEVYLPRAKSVVYGIDKTVNKSLYGPGKALRVPEV